MQMHFIGMQRVFLYSCLSFAFGLVVLGAPPDALAAARVTALVGDTKSDAGEVTAHATLGDEASLETGKDAGAAVLVDDDALMEVCADSRMRLRRKDDDPTGARVVEIERGQMRMVVEPRLGEERIEIHTPAAIATIMGTVFYVEVDALGVTTITTEANKVLVESANAAVKGQTMVDAGQQIVIRPGEAPPTEARKLDKREWDTIGACLPDFHELSLQVDRLLLEVEKAEETASNDIIPETPPVTARGAGPPEPEDDDGDKQDIIESTDDEGNVMTGLPTIDPCDGIGGEHCGRVPLPLPVD